MEINVKSACHKSRMIALAMHVTAFACVTFISPPLRSFISCHSTGHIMYSTGKSAPCHFTYFDWKHTLVHRIHICWHGSVLVWQNIMSSSAMGLFDMGWIDFGYGFNCFIFQFCLSVLEKHVEYGHRFCELDVGYWCSRKVSKVKPNVQY